MSEENLFRGSAAVAAGEVTWKRLGGPDYVRLVRDVYVRRGVRVTHQLRCAAVAMIIPPDAVISGRSAAAVRGVSLAQPWDPVEVVVAESDRFGPVRGLAVRRTPKPEVDGRSWRDARLATVERMGLDLALRPELSDAVADLDAVTRAGFLEPDRLGNYLVGRREHGIRLARRAVEMIDPRAESRPESKLRVILALAGIALTPQVELLEPSGAVLARLDLADVDARLGVEYDGAWKSGLAHLSRDRDRINRVENAGWRLVFITAEQLRDPIGVIAIVRAALLRQYEAGFGHGTRRNSAMSGLIVP